MKKHLVLKKLAPKIHQNFSKNECFYYFFVQLKPKQQILMKMKWSKVQRVLPTKVQYEALKLATYFEILIRVFKIKQWILNRFFVCVLNLGFIFVSNVNFIYVWMRNGFLSKIQRNHMQNRLHKKERFYREFSTQSKLFDSKGSVLKYRIKRKWLLWIIN